MRIFTVILALFCAQLLSAQELNLLLDIEPGTGNSSPANMFLYQGEVYFAADRAAEGKELWKSDGTAPGTVLVKDLRPGPDNSNPSFFFTFHDTLYFSANTGFGNVLFKSDGTSAGTVQISTDFIFEPITVGDSLVYFIYTSQGNALYTFDGTNIQPANNTGQGTETVVGANYALFQDNLYLYMDYSPDEAAIGRELYRYDLFADSFSLVKDIVPGPDNAGISEFAAMEDFLYFEADNDLWMTDGSGPGTMPVATVVNQGITNVMNLFVWNNLLFFEADSGSGDQLFVYEPALDQVRNLSQISGTNSNHDPSDYAPFNGWLYYRGEDSSSTDGHLFRTEGNIIQQMDTLIKDIDDLVSLGTGLLMEGEEPDVTGNELFLFTAPLLQPTISGQTVVCPGETTTLSASGAPSTSWSYTWYADPDGVSQITTGTTFTTPPLNGPVTYYVGIDSANIAGDLVAVTVSIDPELAGGASISTQNDSLFAQPSAPQLSYQWLDSLGNVIPGATSAVYAPDSSGTFFVVVSGTLCTDTSAAFVFTQTTTRLDEAWTQALGHIRLYPNPAREQIALRWTQAQGESLQLEVYDLTGRVLMRQGVPAGQQEVRLSLKKLARGTYLLRLVGTEGALVRRFVKE